MKKNCTVTVGIVALNEDDNIKKMLQSVLDQTQNGYTIDKILVISDGSTDRTVLEVNSLKNNLIELRHFNKRIGKSAHLNTLFQKTSSDIIVLFDADIILADKLTIQKLISPLIHTNTIKYVGGNPQPTHAKTFIEKTVNASFYPYAEMRAVLNNGNNPYGCDGRILALKKEFYKSVKVPQDMIANDNYMYFACITSGHKFQYVKDAVVYFRSPTTLSDQIRQSKRFIAARQRMARIFGDVAVSAYHIPKLVKYKYLLKQFMRQPIFSVSIYLINIYCSYKGKFEERLMNAQWAIAQTTKEDIVV